MPGISRSYIQELSGVGKREGKHANKLALYLKQLLGIAVTHTDEGSGPYCRAETKRPGRESAVRGVESWRMPEVAERRSEGERAEEGNKRVSAYEAFRIFSSGFSGEGRGGGGSWCIWSIRG